MVVDYQPSYFSPNVVGLRLPFENYGGVGGVGVGVGIGGVVVTSMLDRGIAGGWWWPSLGPNRSWKVDLLGPPSASF